MQIFIKYLNKFVYLVTCKSQPHHWCPLLFLQVFLYPINKVCFLPSSRATMRGEKSL